MSHISVVFRHPRLHVVILSLVVLFLGLTSAAPGALYDFQPVSGVYNVAGNWLNYSNSTSAVPTDVDAALVRKGNTLNITAADGGATAAVFRIGAGPQTDINALEGVDPTPPPTYGGAGTLNWTGGDILGAATGPRIYVGERDDVNNINYTGIVNQSGGKVSLNQPTAFGAALIVGFSGATSTPTSVYNLMPGGTIGVTAGTGNNDGIRVRNGTFNMTGGDIVSDDVPGNPSQSQRAITIGNGNGGTLGNESVAYANFSGGTVYTNGGMRMAGQSNTKAYATISGTADLHFRAVDVQLGANATNAYAQLDMSGGSFKVGDLLLLQDRRLIIGDSGTGVFNLSGGAVHLEHSLVVGNAATSKGTLHQTGGTLRVRSVETNRNTGAWDLTTENATILIDGPTAVFNQLPNDLGTTGTVSIGQLGKGRFEVRQGVATLTGEVRLSQNPTSRATLAVTGGKLRIENGVFRNSISSITPANGDFNNNGVVDAADYALWRKNQNTNNALPNDNGLGTPVGAAHYDLWSANFGNAKQDNTPTVILTGGELELAPAGGAMSWQTNMKLEGTRFDPNPGAVMLTNVGSYPNKPGNFSLNAGSVWDLNIANNTTLGGADWVDVPNSCNLATACDVTPGATFAPTTFDGGSINIIPVSGYAPAFGDTLTIVRNSLGGVILGSVSINNPNWVLQTNVGSTAIQLRYAGPGSGSSLAGGAVPEPTSIALVGLFAFVSLASQRTRHGKR